MILMRKLNLQVDDPIFIHNQTFVLPSIANEGLEWQMIKARKVFNR